MATKKATKKAAKKTVKKQDKVYYVVMERKFFSMSPVSLHRTRVKATDKANALDAVSGLSFNKYVVHRVELES